MQNKLKRFSYNQLLVIRVFLGRPNKAVTLKELEQRTNLSGKSLGGVISSLTRTRFRSIPLIDPVGQDSQSSGLRWILSYPFSNLKAAQKEVNRLVKLYD